MTKKIIIAFTSLLILGILLTGIAFFIDNEDYKINGSSTKTKMKLEQFSNIVVDVIDADIKIKNGDTFSISYQLHNKEKVNQVEVIDETLYFNTKIEKKFGRIWGIDDKEKTVYITVPNDMNLDVLELSTIDGNIEIDDRVLHSASLKSTSGNIKLNNVKAKKVNSKVVSGNISIYKSDILETTADGKSADISLDGSFEHVDVNTVSGDCKLNSDKIKNIKIKNVSGDIKTVTPISGISAKSYGKINYCGKSQGYQFNLPGDNAMLTLTSSSGKIDIQTNSIS